MYLIEPCCAKAHFRELRDSIAGGGTKQFMGYGDLSIYELLPAMLLRYDQTEMMILAPTLPDLAAEIIAICMNQQRSLRNGKGNVDVINHLTVIADISSDSSSQAALWLKKNPFGNRLTLIDRQQPDTAVLLPDIAVYGPINLRYGNSFTATVTTEQDTVDGLWVRYRNLTVPVEEQSQEPRMPKKSSRKRRKTDVDIR